jgi:hypothetical protein
MMMSVVTLFLFAFMRVATFFLAWASTHRCCDLRYFKLYDQFWTLDLQVIPIYDSIIIDTSRHVIL